VAVFMDEVKNNMWSPTVKSYLKLYTTMDLKKLAGFLEVEPEKLRNWLLVNKQRSRQTRWSEGALLDGDVVNSSDLDYALQGVCVISRSVFVHYALTNFLGSHPRIRGQGWKEISGLVPKESCKDLLKTE
jgi:hypothetical protein